MNALCVCVKKKCGKCYDVKKCLFDFQKLFAF